jgi:hypothetical protein
MHGETLELKIPDLNTAPSPEEPAEQHERITPTPARVKVLNPLASAGPAMHAELLSFSAESVRLLVPRSILVGSTVQVRTRGNVAFGEVRSSVSTGAGFEIGVEVQRLS